MALNSRSVLNPAWLTHNLGIQASFFTTTVEIFNPSISDATYNATSNTWDASREIVWTGKARLQTANKPSDRALRTNPTSVQEFEVHIDFKGNTLAGSIGVMPDIRPNFQIFVTDAPTDPLLKGFIFNVRSVINSSNPWHRVLLCEVDQEAKRV